MGLLRRLLWWRNRYPSWSFWLGLVITILLSLYLVIFVVVLAAVCVDLVKLISRWIWERLQGGARRRRLPGVRLTASAFGAGNTQRGDISHGHAELELAR